MNRQDEIETILEHDCTVIAGPESSGKTNLLMECAAALSHSGKKALIVLSTTSAKDFYDKMQSFAYSYDISNVAVVKISDFTGTYEKLTKDANTFDRVFFEEVNSAEQFVSIPKFVDVLTFEATTENGEPDWTNFWGVTLDENGETVYAEE